jgi:hypothetical protein
MFLELVSSFLELGSGSALADAVIHSISKKPGDEKRRKIPINKVSQTAVAHIRVTVNVSISFLL